MGTKKFGGCVALGWKQVKLKIEIKCQNLCKKKKRFGRKKKLFLIFLPYVLFILHQVKLNSSVKLLSNFNFDLFQLFILTWICLDYYVLASKLVVAEIKDQTATRKPLSNVFITGTTWRTRSEKKKNKEIAIHFLTALVFSCTCTQSLNKIKAFFERRCIDFFFFLYVYTPNWRNVIEKKPA